MQIVSRSPMPEPYRTRLAEDSFYVAIARICEHCGEVWQTREISTIVNLEVPVVRADECWEHGAKSRVVESIGREKFLTFQKGSQTLARIVALGGYYRRRECRACEVRWTTGEFEADGRIVSDVTKCPKCEGASTARWL